MAWLFPAPPLQSVTSLSLEELKNRFARRDLWGNILAFLLFVGLSVAIYFALDAIAEWHYAGLTTARFLIRPQRVEFAFVAGIIGLFAMPIVMMVLFRLWVGRDEYRFYAAYAGHKAAPEHPFHATKVMTIMCLIGFIPFSVGMAFRIDEYTIFTDDAMIFSPFASLGHREVRPYTSVKGIYEVRIQHLRFEDKVAPYQVIVFDDGTRWESDNDSGGEKLEYQRECARFVAQKSGRPLKMVEVVEEIR